jgi:GH24 family phage-related lysozyme (muramidase)
MSLHGAQAVAKVTQLEGPLNSMEKRIVELEGFSAGDYDDDVGVSTSGVGQTGEFKGKTFKETVQTFVKKAKKTFPKFDKFDNKLQTELVQLYYRGDVNPRFNWVKSVNKGDFKDASVQLLDHKEYKRRKAVKDDGVTKRLEEASATLAKQ